MVTSKRFLLSERQIFKKGDSGSCRPVSLTAMLGKVIEQILLEAISSQMKDEKVIGRSQNEFVKGKSCLIYFIPFYDEKTGSLEEEKAVDVAYLVLSAIQCSHMLKCTLHGKQHRCAFLVIYTTTVVQLNES